MIVNPKEVKKEELKGFHQPTYDEQRFLENKNKTSKTFTVRILWDALIPIIWATIAMAMLAVYQWYRGQIHAAALCCFFTLIFAAWALSYFFIDFFFRERRRKKEVDFETMMCQVSKMELYKKGTYAAYVATDTEVCIEPIMVDSITFQEWHKDNNCPFLLVRYSTRKDPQAKFFQLFLQQEVIDTFVIECF